MHESFLHYIWQLQYFNKKELRTTGGDKIEIFDPGLLNTQAGPDFSNARIRIGPIDWVGSVEIHTHASGWLDHHHEQDRAYDNVILHVVWKEDKSIQRNDATPMPTLELRGRVEEALVITYRQLVNSSFSIPCQRSLPEVNEITRLSMMEKAVIQRLERKAEEVRSLYQQNGNNWEETFYQLLAMNFGFKINSEPFFQLAKSLPLKLLLKQADKQEQVEALLFGQAGFLEGQKGDEYYMMLRREHQLLSRKYSLQGSRLTKAQWRFLRLRPANFPSLRLAEFASLLQGRQNLFSQTLLCEERNSLHQLFTAPLAPYWQDHYQFSKRSNGRVHELGEDSINNIIINSVVPVWVAYGRQVDEQHLIDRSLSILEQLPAEDNKITRTWRDLGIQNNNAFDSQALIELFNNYCQKKSCLQCTIGATLVRPS
jgi:hypothetical protein